MKKLAALALGLSMMTVSVAPVFAQDLDVNLISYDTTKNTVKVISLAGNHLDNIAKDLEMDPDDVETILTRNEGYVTKPVEKIKDKLTTVGGNDNYTTKPIVRPISDDTEYNPIIIIDNGEGQSAMTLPIMTGDYQDVMTLPIMVDEFQDVMTLPADITSSNAFLRGTTKDGYQVAVLLPADISGIDATTLPAIVTDIAGANLEDIMGDVDYTTLPAILGDVDYTTLPAILGDESEYKLAIVTDSKIEKLSEASGKSIDYVSDVLDTYTIKNLVDSDYIDVVPAIEK